MPTENQTTVTILSVPTGDSPYALRQPLVGKTINLSVLESISNQPTQGELDTTDARDAWRNVLSTFLRALADQGVPVDTVNWLKGQIMNGANPLIGIVIQITD